ncbi:GTPase HflX [Salsipaludibacter albus]|uniref:GTPase HflX n=1 Tax=Salsipaludibacter albus TaxID=2849650 RepID=UPI001EE44C3A|nr:GTPase HflX [Salsipaludibacter albus]MBY5163514.1 GTPase HflX [Salsipaludibacter albus]
MAAPDDAVRDDRVPDDTPDRSAKIPGDVLDDAAHDSPDAEVDPAGADDMSRAEGRRARREVIEEGAPREGVDIIRPVERAVVVALQRPGTSDAAVRASLDELTALLDTAGATVVDRVVQRRDAPSAATWIGRGKAEELASLVRTVDADAVVFDDDLAPAQQRNLEEIIRQKVLDRTIVILDIFAQHATSREGKAQVEMAQLNYMLPRLRGWGEALSRQAGGRVAGGGGIGGRGPGETQLEVDRRRINRRISKLRRDLADYDRIRSTKSRSRDNRRVHTVALVGYTNAGKSSLLNALTGSSVTVRDQLFATLDPTVRSLDMEDGREVVVTDTVGFVRKLPHNLVEAFTSTLEESADADLLLLVVDAAHPEALTHLEAVHEVLEEIGADQVPAQVVLNKADVADPVEVASLARHLSGQVGHDPVVVSARTGDGVDELVEAIAERLPGTRMDVVAHVPWERGDLVSLVHERGDVHDEEHDADGTRLVATVDVADARTLRDYLDEDPFVDEVEPWEEPATAG